METVSGRIWYYRGNQEEVGPISWAEIRQSAKSGQLTPADEVRISPDGIRGQWLPVARILHLIPEFSEAASRKNHDDLESEARCTLTDDSAGSLGKSSKTITWQSPDLHWSGVSFRPLLDTVAGFGYFILELSGLIGKGLRKLAIPAAVLTILITINGAAWMWINTDSEQTQIDKINQIGKEFRELQFRKAGDAEWVKFLSVSRQTLEPMIPQFEKYASSSRPIQQQLLWAGRDCLLPMLKAGRNVDPALQSRFQQHMYQIRYKILRIDDTHRIPDGRH